MIKDILLRFKKDPFGFIKRSLYKTIIGPIKYKKGDNYDAEKYWQDRFKKYNLSLKGAGDEGLSKEENEKVYKKAAKIFVDLCQKESIDFKNIKVLEIGCGTGFYTELLKSLGVKSYTGVDITDIFFNNFRKKFPKYNFIKKDITLDKIEGKFDLIIMIDVIEHIVEESKLTSAMENIKNYLSNKGIFMVSAVTNRSKKDLFYVRSWSLEDIKKRFPSYIFRNLVPFRDANMLVIKKP